MVEIMLSGIRLREDSAGFVCLNDVWAAGDRPQYMRPSKWRTAARTKKLAAALLDSIVQISGNSAKADEKSVVYSTGRGQHALTYGHPVMALDYAEAISPALGVEVRTVFLRYRAGDLSLLKDMVDRLEARIAKDDGRVDARGGLTKVNRSIRAEICQADPCGPDDYARVFGAHYRGLYDERTMREVAVYKGLPERASLPDHMDTAETVLNSAAKYAALEALKRQPGWTGEQAESVMHSAALQMRRTYQSIVGDPAHGPEDLPAVEHVRGARRRLEENMALLDRILAQAGDRTLSFDERLDPEDYLHEMGYDGAPE